MKLNKRQKQALVRILKQVIDNGEFLYDEKLSETKADELIDTLINDYDLYDEWNKRGF